MGRAVFLLFPMRLRWRVTGRPLPLPYITYSTVLYKVFFLGEKSLCEVLVRPTLWPSIRGFIKSRIFTKFGAQVLYKKLLIMGKFRTNRLCGSHPVLTDVEVTNLNFHLSCVYGPHYNE